MFLVFFPVNGVEEQVINRPTDAFSYFDTNMENEAKDVMRILISQFCMENLFIYNTSENRSNSWFNSIGDLVNDMNSQELAIDENLWCIDLNLTEEQMREVTDQYKSDFVILDGGKLPTCFPDGEMVVYGNYEEMSRDLQCDLQADDKALALVAHNTDGKEIVHVFKICYDSYDKIGVIEFDLPDPSDEQEWKKQLYPKLCELLKK